MCLPVSLVVQIASCDEVLQSQADAAITGSNSQSAR